MRERERERERGGGGGGAEEGIEGGREGCERNVTF